MEIRDNDRLCIFTPLSKTLDAYESNRLFSNLKKDSRKVAIDLSYVSNCTIDFIKNLKQIAVNKKISVFNIPSDIFVLFLTMNIDKEVQLYINEIDFVEDTRRLLKRNFLVV